MLAIQLINYLTTIPDEANILIYVGKTNETRQLIFEDLDVRGSDGHVVIDAEYDVPSKLTIIQPEGGK